MHRLPLLALILALPGLAASAAGERAGDFDYYVMALTWSPTWCALEGGGRGSEECAQGAGRSFTLHGLWPQSEVGWPSDCRSGARDPSRAETRDMADIMGSSGLAWYEWKKHGRCSGLAAADYFAAARRAYESIAIPPVLAGLDRDVKLPASVVEEAFLEANPALSAGGVTITCDEGRIAEARICLTKDLEPRPCGQDVARDCRMKDALMEALR